MLIMLCLIENGLRKLIVLKQDQASKLFLVMRAFFGTIEAKIRCPNIITYSFVDQRITAMTVLYHQCLFPKSGGRSSSLGQYINRYYRWVLLCCSLSIEACLGSPKFRILHFGGQTLSTTNLDLQLCGKLPFFSLSLSQYNRGKYQFHLNHNPTSSF